MQAPGFSFIYISAVLQLLPPCVDNIICINSECDWRWKLLKTGPSQCIFIHIHTQIKPLILNMYVYEQGFGYRKFNPQAVNSDCFVCVCVLGFR